MRIVLHTIARIGEWEIKERVRKGDTSMSKYAVYNKDGRHMEDFRREARARKWCRENTASFFRTWERVVKQTTI